MALATGKNIPAAHHSFVDIITRAPDRRMAEVEAAVAAAWFDIFRSFPPSQRRSTLLVVRKFESDAALLPGELLHPFRCGEVLLRCLGGLEEDAGAAVASLCAPVSPSPTLLSDVATVLTMCREHVEVCGEAWSRRHEELCETIAASVARAARGEITIRSAGSIGASYVRVAAHFLTLACPCLSSTPTPHLHPRPQE